MKLFKTYISKTPLADGTFHISCTVPDGSTADISDIRDHQYDFAQRAFFNALKKIIAEDPEYQLDDSPRKHIQTLEVYRHRDARVEIADDEWKGIVIESKNLALLESIFNKLNEV